MISTFPRRRTWIAMVVSEPGERLPLRCRATPGAGTAADRPQQARAQGGRLIARGAPHRLRHRRRQIGGAVHHDDEAREGIVRLAGDQVLDPRPAQPGGQLGLVHWILHVRGLMPGRPAVRHGDDDAPAAGEELPREGGRLIKVLEHLQTEHEVVHAVGLPRQEIGPDVLDSPEPPLLVQVEAGFLRDPVEPQDGLFIDPTSMTFRASGA
jgi:hypothetical protein